MNSYRTARRSTNRDFLGASLSLHQTRVFTCAPRTRSDQYTTLASTTGACYLYDSRSGNPAWNEFYSMTNPSTRANTGWTFFTMMGHTILPSSDGSLVVGVPMARANGG